MLHITVSVSKCSDRRDTFRACWNEYLEEVCHLMHKYCSNNVFVGQ